MSSGLEVLKLILEELKGEAKRYKVKVSRQCFGMYKKEQTMFWRAVIRQDYSYLGEGMAYDVEVSIVPIEFDEIRFKITDPGEDIKFTDALRANRGFAFFTISKKKYYFNDSENNDKKEMLNSLAVSILEDVQYIVTGVDIKIKTEYKDVFQYLIAQKKEEPILAGLAYLHLQEYQNALSCFEQADKEENYWNLCYGSLNRYFHHVCRDYCMAMLQGISWNKKYVDGVIEIQSN